MVHIVTRVRKLSILIVRRSGRLPVRLVQHRLVARQLMQRIFHLLITVVNNLVYFVHNLIKSGRLESHKFLVMVR